jgi:hypothetical protein
VEGLCPNPKFEPKLDFGNMWHVCEEAYAAAANKQYIGTWTTPLQHFCQGLVKRFPTQQTQIAHWYELCKAQFPVYQEYWSKHDTLAKMTAIAQEQAFDVPYTLPSGRKVRLRGKWDSLYSLQDKGRGQLWLWENKTKSGIDRMALERQLSFDLQTMIYLTALKQNHEVAWNLDLAGVRYNVIRRSAHKSVKSMLEKIGEDHRNGRIGEWFSRWDTRITEKDIEVFKAQCLHPILETLCGWWDWIGEARTKGHDVFSGIKMLAPTYVQYHWRHPFGVYNVLNEGGFSDVDGFIANGSTVGLYQAETLFPELEPVT